jgi:hypothetical protein
MEHRRRGSTGGACPGGYGHQRHIGRGIAAALAVPGPSSTAVRPWSSGGEEWRKGAVERRRWGAGWCDWCWKSWRRERWHSSELGSIPTTASENGETERRESEGMRGSAFSFLRVWPTGTARMARCRAERAPKGHAAHGTVPGRPRHRPADPNSEIPDCIETPKTLPWNNLNIPAAAAACFTLYIKLQLESQDGQRTKVVENKIISNFFCECKSQISMDLEL